MSRADELRAELAVVELEERLAALKADPDRDPEAYRAAKEALRQARVTHRTLRAGKPAEEGVARPSTVKAKAGVKRPGGEG
jgi:hypothetical protein